MRQFHHAPPPQAFIPRPDCPHCGERMWLARIEPDKPDHDIRTFECHGCGRSERRLIKYR